MGAKKDQEGCHPNKGGKKATTTLFGAMESRKEPPESLPRIAEATVGNVQAKMATTSPEDVRAVTLDPRNPFEAVLIQMVETHRRKAKDYAGDAHPNQNFYDTAVQLGLTGGHSVEALIGTKQARLKVILPQYWDCFWETRYSQLSDKPYSPANEGIQDTLLDRAVYAVIALTIWNENGYRSQTPPVRFD